MIKKILLTFFLALIFTGELYAMSKDDPVLSFLLVDHLEYSQHDGEDSFGLESDFWIGKDLTKFWVKTELESENGEIEEAEFQFLYSKAIKPYWDAQFGIKHDFEQEKPRTWAVAGLNGLSPYYFEIDAALYLGEKGRLAASLEAEYEIMLTQRLILIPEFEMSLYAQNDEANSIGSGLSDASLSLRLRYDFIREFGVYVGYESEKTFGNTAKFKELNGEERDSNQWVVGLRFWF